ncbi:MAG: sulfurtransferase [Chloroflexi bacterium]|nr:sulfurtransferase [Chloroflexota bacterium]MDA1147653.1 sulfurtransferase [Chloroflexota bacterium]
MTTDSSRYLVETDWLEANLDAPEVRVLDCTTFLRRGDDGRLRAESGHEAWAESHIPGSVFADLPGELSDKDAKLRFMMPPPEQFAAAMSSYGVGEGTRAVLYDRAAGMWAARIWWMLRAFGFEDAAVLNGGWTKWTAEGRPTSNEPSAPRTAAFTARPRPELIATREEVLAATSDGATCIINALSEEQHRGEGASPYGRPGRITSSVNVPANSLVDPATNAYLPLEVLRDRFAGVGATEAGKVITYCGGGIAASNDAFALTLLGVENVAIYDASLSEWAADDSLPMEIG